MLLYLESINPIESTKEPFAAVMGIEKGKLSLEKIWLTYLEEGASCMYRHKVSKYC